MVVQRGQNRHRDGSPGAPYWLEIRVLGQDQDKTIDLNSQDVWSNVRPRANVLLSEWRGAITEIRSGSKAQATLANPDERFAFHDDSIDPWLLLFCGVAPAVHCVVGDGARPEAWYPQPRTQSATRACGNVTRPRPALDWTPTIEIKQDLIVSRDKRRIVIADGAPAGRHRGGSTMLNDGVAQATLPVADIPEGQGILGQGRLLAGQRATGWRLST